MKSKPPRSSDRVRVRKGNLVIPTYLPAPPDRNPMFLEKRVYQGSSGRVYPLPFTDRIADKPQDRVWQAIWVENQYLRVLILPELGGRIHALEDRTTGGDLIYRQPVIKPALVGLAGPWISGGIEFNWPQHHRPATFLPVDTHIERDPDGSVTVWCSDHDPMARMKGMHGVCLRPGRAWLELRVRAYNRTPLVQTFLWWANVATRVHEAYQSFFPPDVHYVADHARRSMSHYPLAQGRYYGVDYGARGRRGVPLPEVPRLFRPPHSAASVGGSSPNPRPPVSYAPNDLSFYANIPVPTSYMCMGSDEDFFGGYDFRAQLGIVHVASHHIAPGKKQWTWGNHEFGYAWDRNLTEASATGEYPPYIEIMAGVYTDNQPDFSFLQPGETKTWTQYWYPIHRIGPVHQANRDAAVALDLGPERFRLGVAVTAPFPKAIIRLEQGGCAAEYDADLAPAKPFILNSPQAQRPWRVGTTTLRVLDRHRREIIAYTPRPRAQGQVPPPASEPPAPQAIASTDELFLTGLHLEQYRHATRCPTLYWREAVRRDPGDARCHNALGLWHLRRGEFVTAETHFRRAVDRLTRRNSNPYDGEPHYNLGLCLRYRLEAEFSPSQPQVATRGCALFDSAYAAFYKATWNQAWQAAGYHALAEMDCRRQEWTSALDHLDRALCRDTDNLRARDLRAIVLRKLGRHTEAEACLRATLALDPLDWWARSLLGEPLAADAQIALDLAHDLARAGFYPEAAALLRRVKAVRRDLPDQNLGAAPMVEYTLGWLAAKQGNPTAAVRHWRQAAALSPDYCFPARLEDLAILEAAGAANPGDARAPYYLGNLLYDRRRHEEAIMAWERSTRLDPTFAIVWRNLGIGYFNIQRRPTLARAAYDRAFRANPRDARLLYERDQLWKRLGHAPRRRLRILEKHEDLVRQRDDLTLELCALYNQTGQPDRALALLESRHFQPWEGGEGLALAQHVRTHLALAHQAMRRHDPTLAVRLLETALTSPPTLGEARHLLANQSDAHFQLGEAYAAAGDLENARKHWTAAATFQGDFQGMRVRAFSEMTYYSIRAIERLGQPAKARRLARQLLAYAQRLAPADARIDYFATSLPTMLLFEDDLPAREKVAARILEAQARLALGEMRQARRLLRAVLRSDPSHALTADLLRGQD